MRTLLKPICLLLFPIASFGQKTIFPGSPDINTSRLKSERTLFTIYYVKGTTWTNKGTYTNDVTILGNELKLVTDYKDEKNERYKKRTSVANATTLEPLSYKSEGTKSILELSFGANITGKNHFLNGDKDKQISMKPAGKFVDFNVAELLFTTLPLDVGYKATIREFYYVNNPDSILSNYIIKDVKSYIHRSPKTGNHETWLVSVLEEESGAVYTYIIDKKDHRIWQREMPAGGGITEVCVNEELDYQPIAARFDKELSLQQLEKGNSVITGTAFARDHGRSKVAVVNINRAQYAPKGTVVSIIPNSDYLEEWKAVNKKIAKKNKLPQVPIDPNVSDCIRKTTVYDDKGHFEFTNLMPGEYILITTFGYTHQYSYSYYAGTSYLMHPSGAVLSSNNVYNTANASTGATAEIEMKVRIRKDGDKVDVDLKDVR
ncbi:DUF3108 domain-containing protein [Chitinophaga sancti]|uniref:Carboxypeptidase regulatory-like domain-containing protein n=2 Tax=Chitinophaga sancti TaxID=1004 RepID=A0A1K1R6Y5_9BACT|nr:hypothetical protein [Chitinophaga sancti]WQD64150.1 hypothetical protein U0033_07065 [Chitinophaga sancti]WQG90226.1 hypothetical protein SR876_01855 [Chitinophaga sancti]SFW67903.1 hypothetical protein SAMN05661012_03497 [Chitinophaga sancti]